ncbi:hypothetical protein BDA99DRAFT_104976 [Phascolomyces articulosus]|uniref:Uncharacterized protein n=1 Tax=Phascolomyces articulosus TaxID=60185 RepID=A0AAD5K7V9_9FUNG|nr:hypothetical protein BDA99DRAFT_104976 [Phascolomyces articulosus]
MDENFLPVVFLLRHTIIIIISKLLVQVHPSKELELTHLTKKKKHQVIVCCFLLRFHHLPNPLCIYATLCGFFFFFLFCYIHCLSVFFFFPICYIVFPPCSSEMYLFLRGLIMNKEWK